MNVHIDKNTADKWQKIATRLGQIAELASECELILLMELDARPPQHALQVLEDIQEAVNGQAYMFTPQSEWIGGDNFKVRQPHIVNAEPLKKHKLGPKLKNVPGINIEDIPADILDEIKLTLKLAGNVIIVNRESKFGLFLIQQGVVFHTPSLWINVWQ